MNIKGKIIEIFDPVQVTDKFRKREFVVEFAENPLYPQTVLFQLVQDKCDTLDNYEVGHQVDVSFNLRGRRWSAPNGETRYFNTLEAWRIAYIANVSENHLPHFVKANETIDQEGDLPF